MSFKGFNLNLADLAQVLLGAAALLTALKTALKTKEKTDEARKDPPAPPAP
jgi:hypothetical protein